MLKAMCVLGLVLAAMQEKPVDHPCSCHPREVGASGSKVDWKGYRQGCIEWHYDANEALKIAAERKKLVFWYLVAGDLDKEGC